jgi:hypothetical protein
MHQEMAVSVDTQIGSIMGDGLYRRLGDTSRRTVVEGRQGFLLQIDIAKIVVHEADEPEAVVAFLDFQALAGQHGRDVYFLAVHADAAAGGDEDIAVVRGR